MKDSIKTSEQQDILSKSEEENLSKENYFKEWEENIAKIENAANSEKAETKYYEEEGLKTLFRVVGTDGIYGVYYGNQLASNRKFETVEEAEEFIERKPWELILTITMGCADYIFQKMKKGEQ